MACFADINVSQDSVATYARRSGIISSHLIANVPRNLPVKKILKSVKNRQNYGHESVAPLFPVHPVCCGPRRPRAHPVVSYTCRT